MYLFLGEKLKVLGSGDEPVTCYSRPPFTSTVCTPVFLLSEALDKERSSFWEKARVFRETMKAGLSPPKHFCLAYRVSPGIQPQRQMCVQKQAMGHLKGYLPPPSWPHWAHQSITSYRGAAQSQHGLKCSVLPWGHLSSSL